MATNWPNSVQTFTNPTASSALNSPSHADQHATVNDTVEALQQYAGLVFVKSVTVGSGVSSVTVTDAFDSRFDNYKITINEITQSANQPAITINFGGATGNHNTVGWYMGISSGSLTGTRNFNANYCIFADMSGAGATGSYQIEVLYPYAAKRTHFNAQNASATWGGSYVGVHDSSTSHTSFTIAASTGTLTGGTIRVYGYNNGV